jgi:hypothetical protein
LWIGLWALVPLLSPLVFATAIRLSGAPLPATKFLDLVATQGGLAFATAVLLVATGVLSRRAIELRPIFDQLGGAADGRERFAPVGSIAGPLVRAAAVAALVSAGGLMAYGPVPPLAALPLLFVYLVPIMTYIWTYLVILLELDRLGRRPLALESFPEDPSLGLEEPASLASSGLAVLLIAVAPVLIVASDEPLTLGISLVVVAISVGGFVLSMWRLHGQMTAARRRFMRVAREIYAEVYGPLRQNPSAEMLDTRASALRAAEALDARARGLLTWPIDEGAMRFLGVVVTTVITSVIVRALFAAVGF